MDRTASFYSQPSYYGSGIPIFAGSRRQRGGSILGSISKMVLPALARVGKSIGRSALKQGASFANDVANDLISGQNFSNTMRRRGRQHALSLARSAASSGLSALTGNRRTNLRKRPPPKRSGTTAPAKKRRRVNKKALF